MNEKAISRERLIALVLGLWRGELQVKGLAQDELDYVTGQFQESASQLQRRFDLLQANEAKAPKPGQRAPDFTLEQLDPRGKRTGTMVRLYDFLDKPVALVFGSYT